MQNLKEEPFKYPPTLSHVVKLLRFTMRYRNHPEILEPFLEELEAIGVPQANVVNLRAMLIGWQEAYTNRLGPLSRVDRYLLTGMGAVDLVLLAVLLPQGVLETVLKG